MFLPVPHLPDSLVRDLPVFAYPIQSISNPRPEIVGNRQHIFVVKVKRIHQLSVNVALILPVRIIADSYRTRLLVPFPVRQFLLRQLRIAINRKQCGDLLPRSRVFRYIVPYPAYKALRFLPEPEAYKGVHRERRVTHPRIAVIPISRTADHFGQACRRRGNDRARRLERKQLQRQRRPLLPLAPTSPVCTRRKPSMPIFHRVLEKLFTLPLRCRTRSLAAHFIADREDIRLAFLQHKLRNDASVFFFPQRLSTAKMQVLLTRTEHRSTVVQLHLV